MSSVIKNKALWRALILALLTISMMGPWAFDLLNVPAQYPCTPPNVRLNGDFCGSPVSGLAAFRMAAGGLFVVLNGLIKGNMAASISEFMMILSLCFIVLPFFSTILLFWKSSSRRLQILNLVVCVGACFPAAVVFLSQTSRTQLVHLAYLLWGVWLYLLSVICAMVLGLYFLRSSTRPGIRNNK